VIGEDPQFLRIGLVCQQDEKKKESKEILHGLMRWSKAIKVKTKRVSSYRI
jgi:hypothetical protein